MFFIHPTTFYSASAWNAPHDDDTAGWLNDIAIVPQMASVRALLP